MVPITSSKSTPDSAEIVVREFRNEDLLQVIELFKDGMLQYSKRQQDPHLDDYIANSLKTDLSDIKGTYSTPGGNFWIATPRDDPTLIIGIVGLEAKPNNEGELRRMSVKHTHRRFGIGRLLISTLEHWAVEHGFHKIWLTTGGVMEKARGFYTSMGYTETGTIVVHEQPRFEVIMIEKMLVPTISA
ncbi:Acetyltransferase (GNAT) family [Phytophthora infestans]|uniref:Acetyltransferase (GNAT) family n=1 Tax=Phytophthora infestans TaxID=4787 RepID=A0A833T034_PHYIN|nr:Acetyltransferase (GNAT) family [Phytophthora infestans]KAF4148251.1 Acetyltransferase (GNAT) family [Phytophthora infestans]